MTYQVLARKYRPSQLSAVVGQSHVITALTNAFNRQQLHQAYLLTGTRGVGKTTIARIIAKCLNCEQSVTATPCNTCVSCQEIDAGRFPDLLEVDAASRTKVEDTRELLENVQYLPVRGRYKVYLIDEVHMLSGHSFNALLKTLEEPPAHVKFLLATTDPEKIPATILSRCIQFHLNALSADEIAVHLANVLAQENIPCEKEALMLLAEAAEGSVRDSLSLLDQAIAMGGGQVTQASTQVMLGAVDRQWMFRLVEAVLANQGDALMELIERMTRHGIDFRRALSSLLTLLHEVALLQTIPRFKQNRAEMVQLAQRMSPELVQLFYQIALMGQRDLPYAPSPRVGFVMTLLRMMAFYPASATAIVEKMPQQNISRTSTQAGNPVSPTAISKKTAECLEWGQLIEKLQLTGTAALLVSHCSLQSLTDTEMRLAVHQKHKPFLQPAAIQRINEAVNSYLGYPVALKIVTQAQELMDTPAQQTVAQKVAEREVVKNDLLNNKTIQQLMSVLDAELIEESVSS